MNTMVKDKMSVHFFLFSCHLNIQTIFRLIPLTSSMMKPTSFHQKFFAKSLMLHKLSVFHLESYGIHRFSYRLKHEKYI